MSESRQGWELVDDGETAAASAGGRLRTAREAAGWSLAAMAAELKLPTDRLAALERDEFDTFGPPVFVRGYLRRCALLLDIPPDEVLGLYEAQAGPEGASDPLGLPPGRVPGPDRSGWLRTLVAAAVVAGVLAGGWWFFGPRPDSGQTASAPATPDGDAPLTLDPVSQDALSQRAPPLQVTRDASPENQAPATSPGEPAGSGATVVETGGLVADEVPGTSDLPAEDASEAAGEPAVPAAAETVADSLAAGAEPEEPAAAPAISAGQAEIRIRLMEDCWLEITDAEGRRLAYRLGRAGEVTRVRGTAPVSIFLGNAEGVELTVDGEPVAVRPAARRDGTARLTVGGGAG